MRGDDAIELNQAWVQDYVNFLEFERRSSPHSLSAVRADLALIDFDQAVGIEDLKSILARKRSQGLSARSLARYASSWRSFFKYLMRQGLIDANPAEALKTPRIKKSLPKAVDADRLQVLLGRPLSADSIEEARPHILVLTLYSTGMRISEALSLQWAEHSNPPETPSNQLSIANREIRVLGKGNKTRILPVIASLAEALSSWKQLLNREFESNLPSSVFCERNRKALSVRAAQLEVAEFAKRHDLGQHLHPHMLRHSFGSHMLQESRNLRAVQELLGHSSLASTQVYTSLDFKHLADVYDQAFPRAKED